MNVNVNMNMSNANKWDDAAAAAFATFVAFCDIGVHTLNILITNALFSLFFYVHIALLRLYLVTACNQHTE